MLTGADLLAVTNKGEDDITWRIDGRTISIPSGKAKQVPFDAVRIHLGDPRSGEQARIASDGREKIRIPARSDEYQRLMTLYGAGVKQLIANQRGEPISLKLSDVAPDVEVRTIEGDKVETVVSDPGGEHPEPIPVELDSQEALSAQLAQLQKQQDAVMARLKAVEGAGEAGDDEVSEDGPSRGRRGSRAQTNDAA